MSEDRLFLGTRNHLLITDSVVARGTVMPCPGRLSDQLSGAGADELVVHDAEVGLPGQDPERWEKVRLAREGVLIAHEYVDLGSDPHLKAVAEAGPEIFVRLHLRGLEGFGLSGRLRGDALDGKKPWLVILDPVATLAGDHPLSGRTKEALSGLPYVLVNRRNVTALIEVPEET